MILFHEILIKARDNVGYMLAYSRCSIEIQSKPLRRRTECVVLLMIVAENFLITQLYLDKKQNLLKLK